MVGRLYVAAEIFLRAMSGGVESWENVGFMHSIADFEDMESCQEYLEKGGQRYLVFFEEMAQGLWMDELNADAEDLRVEVMGQCGEPPS